MSPGVNSSVRRSPRVETIGADDLEPVQAFRGLRSQAYDESQARRD